MIRKAVRAVPAPAIFPPIPAFSRIPPILSGQREGYQSGRVDCCRPRRVLHDGARLWANVVLYDKPEI
jgi:hypothetical protein